MNLLVALLIACTGGQSTMSDVDDAAAFVKVAPVTRGTMESTLEVTGTVDAGRSANLVPDFPGKVKRLPVQIGQEVKKGDLLAQLNVDTAVLQGQQAEAAVQLAQLAVDNAKRDFSRAEQLHQRGSLTQQQFDQAQAGLDMAQQQLNQAMAAKGMAREQVSGGRLLAPFDGVVSSVAVEEGEYFNPMTASPMMGGGLVALVNLDTVRIDLHVADTDVGRIAKGMPAHIFVDAVADLLPDEGVEGIVETVGLAADPVSRTFPVRVVASNGERIVRPGMHGRVRLVLQRKEGVDYVPDEAVRVAQGQEYVMTVEDGVAHRVSIETGLDGDQGVEIRSDLAEGTLVVYEGNFGLPDGASVQVVEGGEASGAEAADAATDEE